MARKSENNRQGGAEAVKTLEEILNSKHFNAFDVALEKCLQILRDELNEGVNAYGKEYKSNVIIHGKLTQVVEALGKIQKGQRLASGIGDGEQDESLEKLDALLKELSKLMTGEKPAANKRR